MNPPLFACNRKVLALIVLLSLAFVSRSGFAATSLKVSSTSINFGSWPVGGGGHAVYETLTNNGTTTVTVTSYYITAQFTTFEIYYPLTLKPGASFTFKVKYIPTSVGAMTGRLTISSNAPKITVALSGTGTSTSAPTISPTSYSFGSVVVGTTSSQAATLKAGSSSISISKATTSNPEFTLSGLTLPTTIAAGQSLTIKVNFKPTASGSTSAQISLTAGTKTISASASGSGVAPSAHKVNLTWAASSSTVTGYNVYRGTVAGGPYTRINSSALVSRSYTDSTVSSGKTYYYVTTAVGNNGIESADSNEAKAVVPTP